MSDNLTHRCTYCGYVWKSMCQKVADEVRKAAKVNNGGPVCLLCFHMEMANRVANSRGMNFRKVALDWASNRKSDHNFGKVDAVFLE